MKQVRARELVSKADGDLAFAGSYLATFMSALHKRSLQAPKLPLRHFALLYNLRHNLYLLLSFPFFLFYLRNFCIDSSSDYYCHHLHPSSHSVFAI